jgi:hypothetical protein
MVPDRLNPYWRNCSSAFSGVNALRALSDSSRKLKSVLPRSGPIPGIVMISMCMAPLMPPWFWAANMSMRGSLIERICDFGGRRPPVNPSTRMTDPGGDIALEHRFHLFGRRATRRSARASAAERRCPGDRARGLLVAADGEASSTRWIAA